MDKKSVTGQIHSIETSGTVDGPGIRFVVFMQGCHLRCKFCHNPDSWNLAKGTQVSVESLVKKVLKYKEFFEFSGGGVTVSGGEPLLQIPFVTALFKNLQEFRIHTAVDTSGCIEIEDGLLELLRYTDLVLLDLKHTDYKTHKELTGVGNSNTLQLLNILQEKNVKTWIRCVILEEYTQSEEYAHELVKTLKHYNNIDKIELLPYHEMGKYKWQELGVKYELSNVKPPSKDILRKMAFIIEEAGFTTLV